MQPGAHLQAHRQPLADALNRRADVAVRERVVLHAAELCGVNDLIVEQDLQLERRLEAFGTAHRAARRAPELGTDLVLRVRREVVVDDEPAARAERQPFDPVVLREVEPRPVLRAARRDLRVADRHGRDAQAHREIALEQQRRRLQRVRDVVEAVARDVRRQQRLDVDREAEQVAHRVAVRRAREPAHRRAGHRGCTLI